MSNPLLDFTDLPLFDRIRAEHVAPAVDALLTECEQALETAVAPGFPAQWQALAATLDTATEKLGRAWGAVSHLNGVADTPELRAAYNEALPRVTEFWTRLGSDERLYAKYKAIDAQQLNPAQRQAHQNAIRNFVLGGAELSGPAKVRYAQIQERQAELGQKFSENTLDATDAYAEYVDAAELAGVPDDVLQSTRAAAQAEGREGHKLTLKMPCYLPVMQFAHSSALRQRLYRAYVTRASHQAPETGRQFDNSALMQEILQLRHEQAQLLGFNNFAEVSLATKMAESPDEVEKFLLDLAQRAKPRAQAELDELKAYARSVGGPEDFQPWDSSFYAEKMKEDKLGLSDEELRPYFPLPGVVQGMFELVKRIYGISVEKTEGIPVWHADVTTYVLKDADGKAFGQFYLDPYARAEKRSGAWMDECVNRRHTTAGLQQPVAYLVCNFTPPLAGQPALLTHEEALTLFHEFGHGLHHLLTQVDEAAVAGIHGVAWDAVELPSQFMENWCYDPATLRGFARHWQTGAPMPEDMIAKLRGSRTFLSGLGNARQLEFSLFDLRLHRDYQPGGDARVLETLQRVRDEVAVMQPPAINRMPWSFSHIFAGGYAAGYYSYKWAEVLSADAFAAFEESGFAAETGYRFRDTILAKGGSQEAMDLFVEFRGRKPSIEPLLRHTGLLEAA